ncbi:cyclic nucleotide-binding protein [Leptospira ryugenii]|uniref:Cyclic nucleotide-binding protein n=1 Tax=Leptospira ryugenii TaxID=1917863 RepID=A0A2P2DXA4_9LEPT|nr:cyclic nucleotide-binding protein [Leptospira ryugenii]
MEVPLRIVFHYKVDQEIVFYERIFQILFSIDILLNFRTGFFEERTLVMNHHQVARKYFKSWFFVDFLSAFPFDVFGGFFYEYFGVTDTLRILRILRAVKVFELFKSLRLLAMGGNEEFQYRVLEVINPVTFRLVFFIYWTSLFAHWVACGWIKLTPEFLKDSDIITRYIRSLYWSVTTLTTIGYGDITPRTNTQTIYTMFVMIIGVGIYGYVVGNIASLLSNVDISRIKFQEKLDTINSFLRYKKIPADLSNRIRSYYINLWENRHGIDERDIWEELPSAMKIEVSLFLHAKLISVVPFFRDATEELKREIVQQLKPIAFMRGDLIFREGDVPHNMYFIAKGSVDIIKESSGTVLDSLHEGNFFGEMALIDDRLRSASVRARTFCETYVLSRESFREILSHHPQFAKKIRQIAMSRKKQSKQTGIETPAR